MYKTDGSVNCLIKSGEYSEEQMNVEINEASASSASVCTLDYLTGSSLAVSGAASDFV